MLLRSQKKKMNYSFLELPLNCSYSLKAETQQKIQNTSLLSWMFKEIQSRGKNHYYAVTQLSLNLISVTCKSSKIKSQTVRQTKSCLPIPCQSRALNTNWLQLKMAQVAKPVFTAPLDIQFLFLRFVCPRTQLSLNRSLRTLRSIAVYRNSGSPLASLFS